MGDLGFEGKNRGQELGFLMQAHDAFHGLLEAHDGEAAYETALGEDLRRNIIAIAELIGLPGIRGLIHIAHECLDYISTQGLAITDDGDWINPADGRAYLAMVGDLGDIMELIRLLARSGGRALAESPTHTDVLERFGPA